MVFRAVVWLFKVDGWYFKVDVWHLGLLGDIFQSYSSNPDPSPPPH